MAGLTRVRVELSSRDVAGRRALAIATVCCSSQCRLMEVL